MFHENTRGLSYLIVDDSSFNLKLLSQVLRSIGPCEIAEAADGREAIGKLKTTGDGIDAVISDFRMPNMNGLQLLREVRMARTGAPQCIPFFVVTGFAERALAGLALGLDVDAFLARPVKKRALQRHIFRTCAERRTPKTALEAEQAYADIDVSSATLPDDGAAPAVLAPPEPEPAPGRQPDRHLVSGVIQPGLVALEAVPDGATLARDAVNSAGATLVRAGEEITTGLKAVLMSYAEIDDSLARLWINEAETERQIAQ